MRSALIFYKRVCSRIHREMQKIFISPKAYTRFIRRINRTFIAKKDLGSCGKNTVIFLPVFISSPKNVFLEDYTRLQSRCSIVNAPNEKVIIKKYTGIATGVTIITGNHRSTVGIPHFFLAPSRINDKHCDVIIEEDVWVGAHSMILSGVTIGRGAIVGAGSMVTKDVPPYALVVGRPAKIIAKKFMLEDVIRHEEIIYPPEERLSMAYLKELFETTYKDLKVYGCNTPLTDEQKQTLRNLMDERNYKYGPEYK